MLRMSKVVKLSVVYTLVFVAVFLVAAGISMPSIPKIGGGEGVVTSPGNVSAFTWELSGTPIQVTNVTLKFSLNQVVGTKIYVELLDATTVIASGNQVLASELLAGTGVTIDTTPSADASDVFSVAVTIIGP